MQDTLPRVALAFATTLLSAWSWPTIARAEDDPLVQYRAQSLDIRITSFGFTGFELYRGGTLIEEDYEATFAASPAALAEFDTYDTLMTTGKVLFFSGIAVAVGGIVLIAVDSEGDNISVPGIGLAVGGIALELTGGILISVGRLHINDAVQKFNDDLFKRLHAPTASPGLAIRAQKRF